MWVWKDVYNKLQQSCEFWKKEYSYLCDGVNDLQLEIINLTKQVASLKAANEELQEYKQKYADEVQKRLELVKLLENTPLTN